MLPALRKRILAPNSDGDPGDDRPTGLKRHRVLHSPSFGDVPWPTSGKHPEGRSGNHRGEGVFIASGCGIESGSRIEGAHIVDLAPTVCSMLNVPELQTFAGKGTRTTAIRAVLAPTAATMARERIGNCGIYFLRRPGYKLTPAFLSGGVTALSAVTDALRHLETPSRRDLRALVPGIQDNVASLSMDHNRSCKLVARTFKYRRKIILTGLSKTVGSGGNNRMQHYRSPDFIW